MEKINVHLTGSLMSNMAYCATFEGYDGTPDAGFQPMGYGATAQEAEDDLLEQQEEHDADSYDDPMDGDHDSAMASAGWGTDEDYGGGDDRY